MKVTILFSILILIFLSGCKYRQHPIPDGGPCSYKTDLYPAKVIDILKIDSNMFDVLMTIKTPNTNGYDTINYSAVYGRHMDSTDIRTLDVKIGRSYKYEIQHIETGNCSPYLERLIMEKFEQ